MAITLASNFDETAAVPLDSREVKADTTARDAIAAGVRYQGMKVFVLADEKTYVLKTGVTNGDWVEDGGTPVAARASGTFTTTGLTPTSGQMDETFLYTGVSAQTFTGVGTIASLTNGYRVTVVGSSDTNTLAINHNDAADGWLMKGNAVLGIGDAVILEYNSTLARMVEISRNF